MRSYDYDGSDWTPDDALADGPLGEDHRSCTDIICGVLFFAYTIGMCFVAIWSFINADLEKLLAPIDSEGSFCGIDEGFEEHPYVYWPNISDKSDILTQYVCVSVCPLATDNTVDCILNDDVEKCEPDQYMEYNTKLWLD